MEPDELKLMEELASLDYEFMVQSLLYAFDVLALAGFYPHRDEETWELWIGRENGELCAREDLSDLGRVLRSIRQRSPLATAALDNAGESGASGIEATGAFLEALKLVKEDDPPQISYSFGGAMSETFTRAKRNQVERLQEGLLAKYQERVALRI